MWLGNGGQHRAGSVDGEVLAELRAIRGELRALADRLALAASREDLKGYVTQKQFDDHVASHDGKKADWRWWAAFGLSAGAILLSILSAHVGLVLR